MLNGIWLALILGAILCAAFTGRMEALQKELFDSAKYAVQFVIGLVGAMAFFMGLMRVARDGGLLIAVSRAIAPLMRRLFPDVPPDHPAMGAMILNLASNVLGLGNAATPFGLKAMKELNRLNPKLGVATDAMVLFLCINATSVTILPTGTINVRAAAGSADPFAIFVPTLVATTVSTVTAVLVHFWLRNRRRYRFDAQPSVPDAPAAEASAELDPDLAGPTSVPRAGPGARAVVIVFSLLFVFALGLHLWRSAGVVPGADLAKDLSSNWLLAALVAFFLLVGVSGGAKAYEAAVAGAREGLEVSVRIVPFLVVILVAIGMFRASGALDFVIQLVDPLTSRIGFPAEALPMALLRPLSGSGSFGVMSEILRTHGPDSFVGLVASTLQGSTETTFYVLAVYFGAAGVRAGRHALVACLLGDLAGFTAATAMCHLFFA